MVCCCPLPPMLSYGSFYRITFDSGSSIVSDINGNFSLPLNKIVVSSKLFFSIYDSNNNMLPTSSVSDMPYRFTNLTSPLFPLSDISKDPSKIEFVLFLSFHPEPLYLSGNGIAYGFPLSHGFLEDGMIDLPKLDFNDVLYSGPYSEVSINFSYVARLKGEAVFHYPDRYSFGGTVLVTFGGNVNA